MSGPFEILGLGCVAVDELLYVDAYPAADAKQPVRRWERQCGGLTATALVAAARLGSRCAYAGALGNDVLSGFVLDHMRREGISLEHVRRQAGARPIHSVIVVDRPRETRTIFFDVQGAAGALPDWPPEEVVRSARTIFIDHLGMAGMVRAARIARDAGVPVVADLEMDEGPLFAELLGLIDHLVLSRDFAGKITGHGEPAAAAQSLWGPARRAVVVTAGNAGCWYVGADRPGEVRHQPAFAVNVVDSTGCGDVFHGAYAAALVRGLTLAAAARFASAAAALKATQRGGQAGIPNLAMVEDFLVRPTANPRD